MLTVAQTERSITKVLEDEEQDEITFVSFFGPIMQNGLPAILRYKCWCILLRKIPRTPNFWSIGEKILLEEYLMIELAYLAEFTDESALDENLCQIGDAAIYLCQVFFSHKEFLQTSGMQTSNSSISWLDDDERLSLAKICCFVAKEKARGAKDETEKRWIHIAYFIFEGIYDIVVNYIAKMNAILDRSKSRILTKIERRMNDSAVSEEEKQMYTDFIGAKDENMDNIGMVFEKWFRTMFARTKLSNAEVAHIWDILLARCQDSSEEEVSQCMVEQLHEQASQFLSRAKYKFPIQII